MSMVINKLSFEKVMELMRLDNILAKMTFESHPDQRKFRIGNEGYLEIENATTENGWDMALVTPYMVQATWEVIGNEEPRHINQTLTLHCLTKNFETVEIKLPIENSAILRIYKITDDKGILAPFNSGKKHIKPIPESIFSEMTATTVLEVVHNKLNEVITEGLI